MEQKKPAPKTAKPSAPRSPKLSKETIKDLGPAARAVKGGMLPPTKGCPKL